MATARGCMDRLWRSGRIQGEVLPGDEEGLEEMNRCTPYFDTEQPSDSIGCRLPFGLGLVWVRRKQVKTQCWRSCPWRIRPPCFLIYLDWERRRWYLYGNRGYIHVETCTSLVGCIWKHIIPIIQDGFLY